MSQIDDLIMKLDHLQSTVSNVAMDIVQLREYQASQKENNQKFWAQDWPKVLAGQDSLKDKCSSIEKEIIEFKPLLKQIVDHETRIREVERSVTRMGVLATVVGSLLGAFVTWVLKFVKFGG